MNKVDWSTAPARAVCYANELFWEQDKDTGKMRFFQSDEISRYHGADMIEISSYKDYEPRPTEWPETDERIDRIGRDRTEDDMGHYNELREAQSDLNEKPVSAADFLSEGLKILSERGNQYGSNQRECSFPQAAEAFNALTGHKLKGSDICLIIALVKQVRQYAQPSRFHEDSAVDGVNYLALQSELLKKEREI